MNIKEYKIENNNNEIFITVTVSTHGVAVSDVVLTIKNQNLTKGHSKDGGSGNINKTKIGIAKELKNGILEIETDINLHHIPQTEWQNYFDNLDIKYYLEGGVSGQKYPFLIENEDKHKNPAGDIITVNKYFNLKQILL